MNGCQKIRMNNPEILTALFIETIIESGNKKWALPEAPSVNQ